MLTVEDCMRRAFQALLRGDTAERDRMCALAKNLMNAVDRLAAGGPLIEGDAIRSAIVPNLSKVICLPDRSNEPKL
jgi:hypothetical protein